MRFSANLGFLWTDLALPAAIRAAKDAGFDAVECHWPYDEDAGAVCEALAETALPMLGLNTRRGGEGLFGLAALPDRKAQARAAIDEAIACAEAIDADAIHVLAGRAAGEDARQTFIDNLRYSAGQTERMILIEPLNRHDAPGYFLNNTDQAADLIEEVGAANLRLMFDCYHVGRSEGDVTTRLKDLLPVIGHIQFAAVPDRGAPDHGELYYPAVFDAVAALGWTRPLGAEYRPEGRVEDTLGWMASYRAG